METLKVISMSAMASTVVTLLTGLVNTTPGVLGATWWGWPWAFMYQYVTYPPSGRISFSHLGADFVVWTVIIAILMLIAWKVMNPEKPASSSRRGRR